MKILKHGKHGKPEPTTINAVFSCYDCGCEWLANIATECAKIKHEYHGYWIYCCDCPDCGYHSFTTITTNRQGKDGLNGTIDRQENRRRP